ncbi:TetR/AcrR family transcriptional regulator [Micromonospora sp. WMMD812]|uniref:TetR/AcrR family transcriptional regulator n=1 Tax=Micromonospora sp. WMMD812 TaxID=3015152 RepID=UPI00248C9C1D|nr:TetR/AcrR family transcriptional regulator [Micromonospora sp. WMMD812]WBB69995.1 TetR/AcrR family transcriptional regulator [Micromonospora sp. WMMD812]
MTPVDTASTAGSAPSAPRLTAAGRRTRARIVGAAAELMFRKGVAGTSIPDVQQAAKVSASQIYHYFGDKNDLVRAVIRYQIERTLQGQQPLLDRLDSIEALRAWCAAAIEVQKQRDCAGGCEVGSLASELVESCDAMRDDLVAAFDRWEAPIRDGLRRMRQRGALVPDADVDQLATALLAAVQGGLLLTQVRRSTEPFRAATDAAIGYIETFTA